MALRRLDDAELGRRVRARNARANEAHRARLANAGKRQTSVWLSASLREHLDAESATTGAALSEIVERLLSAALAAPARPADSVVTTQSAPIALADRDRAIVDLHRQGFSQREIAKVLAAKGITTKSGNPLSVDTIQKAIKRASLVDTKEHGE